MHCSQSLGVLEPSAILREKLLFGKELLSQDWKPWNHNSGSLKSPCSSIPAGDGWGRQPMRSSSSKELNLWKAFLPAVVRGGTRCWGLLHGFKFWFLMLTQASQLPGSHSVLSEWNLEVCFTHSPRHLEIHCVLGITMPHLTGRLGTSGAGEFLPGPSATKTHQDCVGL